MKGLAWTSFAAGILLLAGCGDNEAKRFGYKGLDLEDSEPMFFSTGPTVTNWVPARVLSVCENYPLAAAESNLVAQVGVIVPGEEFAAVPEGYAQQDAEPWFTTWTRPRTAFGLEGVTGFLSHFDEDRKVWTTSEAYFSSYWKTEDEALAALAKLRVALAEGYGVKKFHDFDKCWVAEYVRLRVMGVVGQKADGRWSCMLDIQDKNRPGCGPWEPLEEQQERRNHYDYVKAMKVWRADVAKALADNHALVEKSRTDAGLAGLADAPDWQLQDGQSGAAPCMVRVVGGYFTNSLESAWTEKLAVVKDGLGLAPATDAETQQGRDGAQYRGAVMQDARYDVRLDMLYAPEPPADASAETNAVAAAEAAPRGQWRILCFERLQPGITIPARPVLAK